MGAVGTLCLPCLAQEAQGGGCHCRLALGAQQCLWGERGTRAGSGSPNSCPTPREKGRKAAVWRSRTSRLCPMPPPEKSNLFLINRQLWAFKREKSG